MTHQPYRLAIVTGKLAPKLSDNGQQVTARLAERGFLNEPVMWDDPTVSWQDYDGVLIRSCWDYPEDTNRFQTMVAEIESAGVPICNPLPILRWNLHKSYLTDLSKAGVKIPETVVIDQETDISLKKILRIHDWEDVVVKPAIGAGSSDVWRTKSKDVADSEGRFSELLGVQDVIVQKFVPDIAAGERSIVCFDGEYSHAWNSLPKDDDITAFEETDADYEPPSHIRKQAAGVLESASDVLGCKGEPFPYARIDYVNRDSDLLLMELELIEPYLGLERGDGTVERFCNVIDSYFRENVE